MFHKYIEQNQDSLSVDEIAALSSEKVSNLYSLVQENGGFIEYYSEANNELLKHPQELALFQKHLLNFEKNKQTLKGQLLQRAHYIEQSQQVHHWTTPSSEWLNQQLIVWRFAEAIVDQLNRGYFTFDSIGERHGKQVIDIRMQDKYVDTFNTDGHNSESVHGLTINDYIQYVHNPTEFHSQHPEIDKQKVLFAVNIDMDKWKQEVMQLKNYMPSSLQNDDGLQYLRQLILGVNVPQIYMKVEGVWTGGHQENGSVNALNLNHGPDSCLWITVDNEHVGSLLKLVPNLLTNEGQWFKEIDYFLQNGIPAKQTIQRKGDLIILGAGCLHWVRSLGKTINSSWNYISCSDYTYQAMYARQIMNESIKSQIVIPVKSLMLDIYIHRQSPLLQKYLLSFIRLENEKYSRISEDVRKIKFNHYSRQVLQCSQCGQEIFMMFQRVKDQFHCLNCTVGEDIVIECKYNPLLLHCLLHASKAICSEQYCSVYVGKSQCEANFDNLPPRKKPKQKKVQVEQILNIVKQESEQPNNKKSKHHKSNHSPMEERKSLRDKKEKKVKNVKKPEESLYPIRTRRAEKAQQKLIIPTAEIIEPPKIPAQSKLLMSDDQFFREFVGEEKEQIQIKKKGQKVLEL